MVLGRGGPGGDGLETWWVRLIWVWLGRGFGLAGELGPVIEVFGRSDW